MNQAIELVEEISGRRIDVERQAPQSGDVRNTGADLSKSREILGYSPHINLRDGLRCQIESMAERARAATCA
jgi:nucleoside-diphosphate-sugar epimerase